MRKKTIQKMTTVAILSALSVDENGALIKNLIITTINASDGPNINPAKITGKLENWISKNDGKINGKGNFKNI